MLKRFKELLDDIRTGICLVICHLLVESSIGKVRRDMHC